MFEEECSTVLQEQCDTIQEEQCTFVSVPECSVVEEEVFVTLVSSSKNVYAGVHRHQ